MSAQKASVIVAAATYRRLGPLGDLLDSLSEMVVREPFDVVIVDNDPAASAVPYLEARRPHLPYRLVIVHEPTPGISAARNAALDAASEHDTIVFIDDDERADAGWLAELLRVRRARGCAAVTGPVEYRYAQQPPRWAVIGGFYMEPGFRDGDAVAIAGTNNLLLDLTTLRRLGLRFDPAFGLTGGSDIVLTRALTDAGEEIVWAAGAVVRETMPAERCGRRWLVRRAVRTGNSYGLMHLHRVRNRSALRRARERSTLLVTGVLRVLSGAAGTALHPRIADDPRGAQAFRTLLRGIGVVRAALGSRVVEYARMTSR